MIDRDVVRRGYDDLGATYAAERSADDADVVVLEEFLRALDDPNSILDAGCGPGEPVLDRLSEEATAIGLDCSRGQLRLAADAVPDAALVQGDLASLPFAADVVDAVVALWSLIHVPVDDHVAVLSEFAHVLRPGGRLLLCEGTNEWNGTDPDWIEEGVEMQWSIAGAAATREHLGEAGFRVVETWGVPDAVDDEAGDPVRGGDEELPWTFFVAELKS